MSALLSAVALVAAILALGMWLDEPPRRVSPPGVSVSGETRLCAEAAGNASPARVGWLGDQPGVRVDLQVAASSYAQGDAADLPRRLDALLDACEAVAP